MLLLAMLAALLARRACRLSRRPLARVSTPFHAPHRPSSGTRPAPRRPNAIRRQRKPDWVTPAIVRLAARQPDDGCRRIADTFNRLYTADTGVTVGKSHVADLLRRHHYAILHERNRLKNRVPPDPPLNRVWGVDLTGKADDNGRIHPVLGVVEHRSRRCLTLAAVRTKATTTILRHLLDAIDAFGAPRIVRTDNEAIFTSRLFRATLAVLGIRHQRTERHAPWQNGRIERLFGTLKHALDRWCVADADQLARALREFRFFYNHVRPHQRLNGRTPVEAWQGRDPFRRPRRAVPFSAWQGLLGGYYFPD